MTEAYTGPPYKYPHGRIIIFARTPVAGQVKTRLATVIGNDAAARVYRELFSATVAMASASALADVVIYIAGDPDDAWVNSLAGENGIKIIEQSGEDLGERMYTALARELEQRDYSVLIGTDSPVLKAGHIDHAFAQLAKDRDVIISPAEDGGYVLIGSSSVSREWFEQVDWGTGRVMEQTRYRILSSGYRLEETEALWDVDNYADLVRWQSRTAQQ